MEKYKFQNNIERKDIMLGIIVAENIILKKVVAVFEERLKKLLEDRKSGVLSEKEELRRKMGDRKSVV